MGSSKKWFSFIIYWFAIGIAFFALMIATGIVVNTAYQFYFPAMHSLPTVLRLVPFAVSVSIIALFVIIKQYRDYNHVFLSIKGFDVNKTVDLALLNTLFTVLLFGVLFYYKNIIPSFKHLSNFIAGNVKFIDSQIFAKPSFMLIYLLAKTVFIPIGTEIILRGLAYDQLKEKLTKPGAIIILALVFASLTTVIMDLGILAFLGLFLSGLIYTYAYEKTSVLWVPIFLHVLNSIIEFFIETLNTNVLILFSTVFIIIILPIVIIRLYKNTKLNS